MATILDDAEIRAVGAKTWRLDAARISLRCPRWDRTLRGTGSLEMSADEFVVRFFPYPGQAFDIHSHAFAFPPTGKIVSEQWYASGTLKDLRGRSWQIAPFQPSYKVGEGAYVLSGNPPALRCRREAPQSISGNTGALYFFPKLRFPANTSVQFHEQLGQSLLRRGTERNAAELDLTDLKIRFLSRETGECRVHSASSPLPPYWPWKICEALQLITAREHEWTIAAEWTGSRQSICVRFPRDPEPSQLLRPLHSGSPAAEQRAWAMFEAFLRLLWQDAQPTHNIGMALRAVARASNAYIEAYAVQLGIAIERLLRREFPDAQQRVSVDKAELDKAIAVIEKAGLDSGLTDRIAGAINAIRNPRPQELLSALADDGLVRRQFVRVYGKLRNPAAHGKTADEALQGWIDLTSAGVAMLYELILARIGYEGPYTDHADPAYPVITYPPSGSLSRRGSTADSPGTGRTGGCLLLALGCLLLLGSGIYWM